MSTAKPKRIRLPAVKRDPVIGALIAKLPAENAAFTRAQRVNWLRMMAMAFDGAFGVQTPIAVDSAAEIAITGALGMNDVPAFLSPKPAPIAAPADDDEVRYFVDKDGFARKEPGNVRVRPVDVPSGATIEDERDGDDSLDTIKWADGQWPPAAYPDRSFVFAKA